MPTEYNALKTLLPGTSEWPQEQVRAKEYVFLVKDKKLEGYMYVIRLALGKGLVDVAFSLTLA